MSTDQRAPEPSRYLRPPDAAARIGAAAQTLARWRHEGTGPPYLRLTPRLIVYELAALDAWCAARRRTSTSDPGPGGA